VIRVISGTARGVRLSVPKGERTRPTADRVKETLFNILGDTVRGSTVLDLFAGTGALGIEALSRGAAWAAFVEMDRSVLSVLRANLERVGFDGRAKVVNCRIPPSGRDPVAPFGPYDLVFLDPPYERSLLGATLRWIDTCAYVQKGARIVAEHSIKEELPSNLQNLKPSRVKRFGETVVSFLTHHG